MPMFGELVMFLTVAVGKRRQKMGDRYLTGMFVGLVDRSDEVMVLMETGCYRVNCMKRLPAEQRGDRVFAEKAKGLPWNLAPGSGVPLDDVVPFVAAAPIVPEEELLEKLPDVPISTGPMREYIRREIELRPKSEGG